MKRKIVCLCGSARFRDAFNEANISETKKGNIVLSIAILNGNEEQNMSEDLQDLHFDKIEIADEILILDVSGYIGESTKKEIDFAEELNKKIRYLSDETEINSRWKKGDILYSLPSGKYRDKIKRVEKFDSKFRYEFDDGCILWDTSYYWELWTNDISKLSKV